MTADDDVRVSKFLSWVLRHEPDAAGLTLDAEGYASVDALLAACAAHGHPITRDELAHVVRDNDKQRFAFSADGTQLRASQGHSVEVALGYTAAPPPAQLYHGTVERFLPSIRAQGLLPGARQYVQLSAQREIAIEVGRRRGRPVVLTVDAAAMAAAGFAFYLSANGVWMTREVPPSFLTFP
jgi:putative RNA 2'-phosphotransferase